MSTRARLEAWLGSGETLRHRAITLSILLVAGLLMLFGAGKSVIRTYDNLAKADRLLAISLIMSGVPENALPVTLVDVDDATRAAWKAEGATPHAALAEVARLAAERQARAIVIDSDLTMDRPDTPADPALLDFLDRYPAGAPLLMLVRRINFRVANGDTGVSGDAATPYDTAVRGKPNVAWVAALNQPGADGSVRNTYLWQSVCDGAIGVAYPSPALLAASWLKGGDANLPAFLQSRAAAECGNTASAVALWPKAQAAAVSLPYVFGDVKETRALFRLRIDGKDTVVLRRISAGQLVQMAEGRAVPAGDIDADPFAGRVTVIGASYTGNGDMHDTPLGMMPGSVIVANSLVQARTLTENEPVSPWLSNSISVLLFLIFAFLARKFVAVAALSGIFVIALAAMFICARLLGFEAAFAILAVGLSGFAMFKLVDMVVQLALQVPKRGWRVLLKH